MEKIFDKQDLKRLFAADFFLETSISELYFTEQFVYKIKKPVKFGFVDFTAKKERDRANRAEYEINKIFSPDIYLALIRVARNKDGNLAIQKFYDSKGEYITKMVRLPSRCLLKFLLSKREIDCKIVLKIAEALAIGHKKIKSGKIAWQYGTEEAIRVVVVNLLNRLGETCETDILGKEQFGSIKNKFLVLYLDNCAIFKKRLKEKRIQRMHGDLRSVNVFIKDKKPIFIDTITAVPNWQYGDCAIDVAAIVVDFNVYGLDDLGKILVDEYAKISGDSSIKEIILFYKIYEALINLWINLLLCQEGVKSAKKEALLYRDLIFRYLDIK